MKIQQYNSRCLVYGTAQTYIPEYVEDSRRQLTKNGHKSKFAQMNNVQAGAPTALRLPSEDRSTGAAAAATIQQCHIIYQVHQLPLHHSCVVQRCANSQLSSNTHSSASHGYGHPALPWTALNTRPHGKCSFFSRLCLNPPLPPLLKHCRYNMRISSSVITLQECVLVG